MYSDQHLPSLNSCVTESTVYICVEYNALLKQDESLSCKRSKSSHQERLRFDGKSKVIYAGVSGKGIYRTTDAGTVWQIANKSLPAGVGDGANVKTAPSIAGEVWVSLKEKGL